MKKFLCLSLVCVSRGLRGNLLTRLHSYRARDSGINFARRRVISQMTGNNFESLGVVENLRKGLSSQDIETPTPVQRSVIPRLMQRENVLIAATTGSGKTLSYVLPTIQSLCFAEDQGYVRKKGRPRVIVLVPTRELAQQVLQTFKSLSHYAKISSCAVFLWWSQRPRGQGERDQWPRERERKRRVVPSRGECCVSKMWVCNVQISDWTGWSGAP